MSDTPPKSNPLGSMTATFGTGGTKETEPSFMDHEDNNSDSFEFDMVNREIAEGLTEEPAGEAKKEEPEAKPEGEVKEEKPEGDPEALPEFDKASTEVVTKYDAKFLDAETGELNLQNISDAFWAGKTDELPGALDASTKAWVRYTTGLSDKGIDDVCAALVAQQQVTASEGARQQHEWAGGAERFTAAFAWAAEGYDADRKARFDKAMKSGDAETRKEAVELLVARFDAANPAALAVPAARRRASPERTASSGKPAVGSVPNTPAAEVPFANRGEWAAAMKVAAGKPSEMAKVRARLAVTPDFT